MEKQEIRKQKKCRAYISKDAQIEALKERIKELKKVFRATHKTKYELIKELEEEKTRAKELEEKLKTLNDVL